VSARDPLDGYWKSAVGRGLALIAGRHILLVARLLRIGVWPPSFQQVMDKKSTSAAPLRRCQVCGRYADSFCCRYGARLQPG